MVCSIICIYIYIDTVFISIIGWITMKQTTMQLDPNAQYASIIRFANPCPNDSRSLIHLQITIDRSLSPKFTG